jgi:hypothetical protein
MQMLPWTPLLLQQVVKARRLLQQRQLLHAALPVLKLKHQDL